MKLRKIHGRGLPGYESLSAMMHQLGQIIQLYIGEEEHATNDDTHASTRSHNERCVILFEI
jgi:hypothetical protein